MGEPEDAPEHPRLIKIHPKADLPGRGAPDGSLPVSSVTGAGVRELLEAIEDMARGILPDEDAIVLNRRQAALVEEAAAALSEAASGDELAVVAESLRAARGAFDRLTGRAGVEEVLDALFGRFCLGK
jgi:tRNA modification GTPase